MPERGKIEKGVIMGDAPQLVISCFVLEKEKLWEVAEQIKQRQVQQLVSQG